jgi:hypothetical protein
VVENKQALTASLNEAQSRIAVRLNLKWVDFLIWDRLELKKKRNTIFYYDMCRRHKVVLGDELEFRSLLHYFDSSEISTYDIRALYRTRSWAVLSLYSSEDLLNSDPVFRNYQFAKVVFAIADFLCLGYGEYHTSYQAKIDAVKKLPASELQKYLLAVLDAALLVKITPNTCALSSFVSSKKQLQALSLFYVKAYGFAIHKRKIGALFSVFYSGLSSLKSIVTSLLTGSFSNYKDLNNRLQIEKIVTKSMSYSPDFKTSKGFVDKVDGLISKKL